MLMEHKILAVDDNNINLKLLNRTLSNNNFSVLTASSGKEAIEITNKERPDLILLDVLMPEMDGYEACKILKSNEDTKHIPVIFLSAKNETIDKARGLALGGSDYLTKPFDPIEIIARIRSHISIRQNVIDLAHKNELLKNKLIELQSGNGLEKPIVEELNYLEKIKDINYRIANKYFQINSRIKFSAPPTTTAFIPAYLDNNNFIFMVSGGFKKDYKTSLVQLLLMQHVKGFYYGKKEKTFYENDLHNIFEIILNGFSPDIFDTAFTLSVGFINATKLELIFFTMHQTPPIILDSKMVPVKTRPLPVFFESQYSKIVKAHKIKLPPNATLFNYISGKSYSKPEKMIEMANQFSQESTNINSSIDSIFNSLPEKNDDQLIFAVKLL